MNCLSNTGSFRLSASLSALLLLLTGCVTTDGGTSTARQYLDLKNPVFQQRTDLMIEAFEKGCLDRRVDEVMAAGKGLSWPDRKITMPVRSDSNAKAEVTSLITATSNRWNKDSTGASDPFLKEVLKAEIADSPYVLRCHQRVLDVDYDRILEAMKQTGYLGSAKSWYRKRNGFVEAEYYFTFPQNIPVVLLVLTESSPIWPVEKQLEWVRNGVIERYQGHGENAATVYLYIGLSTRQMPPVTIRQLLNEMSLVASDSMRQTVALTTREIQTALTAYNQASANAENERHAQIQRNFAAAVARTKANSMSSSEAFSSGLNQSLQNMQRQQKAYNDIDRKVGTTSNSQQRLDAAARRTQEYYSGGSTNSSGSNTNGPSLTSACPTNYVAPPAKYAGEWPPLRYGCDQPYKSEAEVQAVFAGWVSKREASDSARTARIRAQQDAIARSKANAVKDKQKCTGCTVSK